VYNHRALQPDMAIVDINMPGGKRLDAIEMIRS
jgi:DNA-binding NarL/FixJ family response regulator